jgi:hypothetical protein
VQKTMTTRTGFLTGKRDLLHHEMIGGIGTATTIVREGIKGVTVTMIGTGEETSSTLHGVDIPMVIEDLVRRHCLPRHYHRGPLCTHPRTTWQLDTVRETTPPLGSVSGEQQADREGIVMTTTSRAEAMAVQGRIGIMAVGLMTTMTAVIVGMIEDILVVAEGIGMGMGEIKIDMRRLEGVIMIVINERVPIGSRIISVMYKKAVYGSRCKKMDCIALYLL